MRTKVRARKKNAADVAAWKQHARQVEPERVPFMSRIPHSAWSTASVIQASGW
jgi:hypothetical protein